jgi:hypothetical protein
MKGLILLTAAAVGAFWWSTTKPAHAADEFPGAGFWQVWGDGQAEVAAYDLAMPRYGEIRRGTAVSIMVTEPFSNSARVKADDGKHPASDVFPVMKLNLIKDFQTGVYDYNDMLSSFLALKAVNGRAPGSLTKAVYSRQEWCGSTFNVALFDQARIRATLHSYFDGEGDQQKEIRNDLRGIPDDQLIFWARGMAEPWTKPGDIVSLPYLTSTEHAKDTLVWRQAQFKRSKVLRKIPVGQEQIEAEVFTVQVVDGIKKDFVIERTGARRLLRWEFSTGEKGTLIKSARMKYWDLKKKGGEEALRQIGIIPRPPRTM